MVKAALCAKAQGAKRIDPKNIVKKNLFIISMGRTMSGGYKA